MTSYQILSRKYRPQTFDEVVEQSPVVTTLRNAILHDRISNAYLFCGTRGTGKTTLARLFAKAINCEHRTDAGNPCNQCSSCTEVTSGHSLDVLEIDGASNRGIDDIRELNENAFYAPTHGRCKIYIIDEVHMLTKEAFNALLKTLEEPPKNVKFFFATTEPHKVLPTIISRCQRFDLKRLSLPSIAKKLRSIADDQDTQIEEEALALIAKKADGSMRDAESLLDQALCSLTTPVTYTDVASMVGIASKDLLLQIDTAFEKGDLGAAFSIAHEVYSQGKDIPNFIEGIAEHFRTILMCKLGTVSHLSSAEMALYESQAAMYSQNQCLAILDLLNTPLLEITKFPWKQIHLEMILLSLLRSRTILPMDTILDRLEKLQHTDPSPAVRNEPSTPEPKTPEPQPVEKPPLPPKPTENFSPPVQQDEKPAEKLSLSDHQKHERILRFTSVELNGTVKK